ncbi:hypothetical protein ACFLZW_06500 [Chloroflexota bacterium]
MGYYDMVVIDELGPVELRYRQGFLEALELIERRRFKTALVVVRPTLLEVALQTWSNFDISVKSLDR